MYALFSRYSLVVILNVSLVFSPQKTKAWGPEGHAIIVKLAMQFANPDVRQNVLSVLNNMSLDTAANWMDIMRANSDYDFMKPWHYLDFGKNESYQPSTNENIVNRIIITYNELRHKKVLCDDQIKMDLLILFHLAGDLTQPLHAGYDDDFGGNRLAFQFDTLKTNLHKFWDEDIIRLNNITMRNCLDYYESSGNKKIDTIEGFSPVAWMRETRSLLDDVYDYSGFTGDNKYLIKNKPLVIRQLLVAALRLAEMLNQLFISTVPDINMEEAAATHNGIEAKDAIKYIGTKHIVCGRVYGIKTTDKVSFMNVGGKYPNAPLTVVIFAKDRKNFPKPLEELFDGKNICIKGEIINYQGKAEIIITTPGEIELL